MVLLYLPLDGQETVLSDTLKIEINAGSLQQALHSISDKTGVRFAYRMSLLEGKTVNKASYRLPTQEIISHLLKPNRLCYTYQNNQIILHTNCLPRNYTFTGFIFEDSTFKPIPYVAVSMTGRAEGSIADHSGRFELIISYTSDEWDTLVFSSMGYERDTFLIKPGSDKNNSFILKPKIYPVEPVIIRPVVYEVRELGNRRDRQTGSLYLDTHGQQTALYIRDSKNKRIGKLISISFYLSKKGNTNAPLRIRVYKPDTHGLPGINLLKDALVVKPDKGEGWYTYNLEQANIEIPVEGLFVAIEGVFPDEYEYYQGSSDFIDLANQDEKDEPGQLTYGQRIGYNRQCRRETWHYSMSKVWFQLEKQTFGVMISAVVKYEKRNETEKNSGHE